VPESTAHSAVTLRIYDLLSAWAAASSGRARVARSLAVRWLEQHPKTGIDPDVCVLDPAPQAFDDDLSSLCLWKPGHLPPRFCVEVVSASHPYKDYAAIQERYAALGTPELVVFDPLLYGPRSLGGPVPLQLWRRDGLGTFERVHFGSDPAYSQALELWLIPSERQLIFATDSAGASPVRTALEQERAARMLAEQRLLEMSKPRS
jgi:Uma2 family endonuclease